MPNSPMRQQFGGVISEVAQGLLLPFLRFLCSWFGKILPWLALICFFLITYEYVCKFRDRPVSVLLGPYGGSNANQVKRLQTEFKKWTLLGPNYALTSMHTRGYVDNYRYVSADQEGNVVGFTMDGFEEGSSYNIRTILPMDWEYLHLLIRCDRACLDQIKIKWPADSVTPVNGNVQPISFTEWAANVRNAINDADQAEKSPVRLFLGPRGSGTRLLAKAVLKHANIPMKQVETTGIDDFQEMLVALRHGEIGGAFYLGPLRAHSIKTVAAELPCTLVSMDPNTVDKLMSRHPFLELAKIPISTYVFGHSSPVGEVITVGVRRVLVASTSMSSRDAYHIARHVQRAFPSAVARAVSGENKYEGPYGPLSASTLRFRTHEGAIGDPIKPAPPSWFDRHAYWLGPLLASILLGLISEYREVLSKWTNRHQPPAPPGGDVPVPAEPQPPTPGVGELKVAGGPSSEDGARTRPPEFVEIQSEIDGILKDMHEKEEDLIAANMAASESALEEWRQQIGLVYKQVHDARLSGKLDEDQSLELKERAMQLRHELEVLRQPPWQPASEVPTPE